MQWPVQKQVGPQINGGEWLVVRPVLPAYVVKLETGCWAAHQHTVTGTICYRHANEPLFIYPSLTTRHGHWSNVFIHAFTGDILTEDQVSRILCVRKLCNPSNTPSNKKTAAQRYITKRNLDLASQPLEYERPISDVLEFVQFHKDIIESDSRNPTRLEAALKFTANLKKLVLSCHDEGVPIKLTRRSCHDQEDHDITLVDVYDDCVPKILQEGELYRFVATKAGAEAMIACGIWKRDAITARALSSTGWTFFTIRGTEDSLKLDLTKLFLQSVRTTLKSCSFITKSTKHVTNVDECT